MRKIVLLNLLVCLCWGCGGHYEDLLEHRKTDPNADPLSAAQELPGTKVSIRVPRTLGSPVANVEDSRSKPGIVTIPDLKLTYEGFIEDRDHGQQPYYCYVGAVAATAPMQDVANRLRMELVSQPQPSQTSDWTDIQGETPEGRKIAWRKLRFTGPQPFYYKNKNGQGKPQSMDGVLEIYLHEEAGFVVIVAWRLPNTIESAIHLDELARQTAGGVSVRP